MGVSFRAGTLVIDAAGQSEHSIMTADPVILCVRSGRALIDLSRRRMCVCVQGGERRMVLRGRYGSPQPFMLGSRLTGEATGRIRFRNPGALQPPSTPAACAHPAPQGLQRDHAPRPGRLAFPADHRHGPSWSSHPHFTAEQHVEPAAQRRVYREEIGRDHCVRLGTDELRPRRICPCWGRVAAGVAQDLPHGTPRCCGRERQARRAPDGNPTWGSRCPAVTPVGGSPGSWTDGQAFGGQALGPMPGDQAVVSSSTVEGCTIKNTRARCSRSNAWDNTPSTARSVSSKAGFGT